MQRVLFTVIAYAAIIACVDGQDPKDPVKASDTGPEHANLKAFAGTWELTIDGAPRISSRFSAAASSPKMSHFPSESSTWIGMA